MNKFLLLLALPFFFSCGQSIVYSVEKPQPRNTHGGVSQRSDVTERQGKCFKNCMIPPRYETRVSYFPIFTGSEGEAPLRSEILVVEPPKSRWEKKKSGELCFVEVPAVTREIRVLADTLFYRDFQYQRFEYKAIAEKGGFVRETEVVCSDERTPDLYLKISAALKSSGYFEQTTAQWNLAFSQALQQFQKDNGLPVGDLSIETIRFMGI
jgi:hypothetical protein